jgi:hypothetical protein
VDVTSTVLTKDPDADPPQQPDDDAAPDAQEQPSAWVARLKRWTSDTRAARLVELLALVPLLSMILEVSRAGKLQWLDYWYVMIRIVNNDGSFNLPGLFVPQNEHPLIIPSLFYYADAKLADGDNRILGYLVIVIAAATVLLLRAALPKALPPLVRASVVVASSALIFSLHGIHLFVRSMSGSAWLTANLFVIAALLLAYRGKYWGAWAVGLVACATYGTSFAVWPVLAMMAWVNREPLWKRWTPVGLFAAVIITYYILRPVTWIGGSPAHDVGSLIFLFLSIVGHLWTGDNAGVSVIVGVGIMVLYLILLGNKTARAKNLRMWWGVALYSILACGMIAVSRVDFGSEFGLESRYSSLATLVAIPLLVLGSVVAYKGIQRNAQKLAAMVVGVGVAGFTLGVPAAAGIRGTIEEHELEAIAIRSGYGDALGPVLPTKKNLEPKLISMQHYPMNGTFTIGCGGPELGDQLDMREARPLHKPGTRAPAWSVGEVDSVEDRGDASLIIGWATGGISRKATPVKCTVVVDRTGKITGAGVSNLSRTDLTKKFWELPPNVGFKALGPVTEGTRVVVIYEGGAMRWMPVDPDMEPDRGDDK